MSVIKRGKVFHLKIRPYGAQIMIATHAQTKTEAANIEAAILTALRAQDYRSLWPEAREVCLKLFRNRQWETPPDLGGNPEPQKELSLWRACELFLNYPGVKDHPSRWRYEIALSHIIDHFGRDVRLKALWIPELKAYQVRRQNEGAASNTINRELSTLSRLFVTMIEQQLVESNPVHLVRHLSTKSGQRQTYLSRETVQAIAGKCPEWFRFILWTAYYTGMRRGELLTLSRRQVNLNSRIITLTPGDTKEEHWKRIPIHRELIPVLEAVLQGPSLISGKVFGLYDSKGIRELGLGSFTNVWPRVCKALKLEHPWPRFHDLRHTWKTNARRSGMHPEIEKAIMGHVERGKSIHEGYGFVDNQELLQAIDLMSFDHGETVVMVAGKKRSVYRKKW